jgi:hypothetical protein
LKIANHHMENIMAQKYQNFALFLITWLLVSCAAATSTSSNQTLVPTEIRPTVALPGSQDSDGAEISPTPTENVEVATPSKQPGAVFDISTANQLAPDGILEELSFYGGGGGYSCKPDKIPYILIEPSDGELMTLSTMVSCGWQDNEVLQVSILYPDGKSRIFDLNAENDGLGNYYVQFGLKTAIGDPPGRYTVILKGKNGSVESDVHFRTPDGPRIVRPDHEHIYLYGFAPDERVRLFYYAKDGQLAGWTEYRMNPGGELLIEITVDTSPYFTYFYAIGDNSGETRLLQEDPMGETVDRTSQKSIQVSYCGSLQPRVFVGDSARVAFTDGSDMRIRQSAGLEGEILHKVPEGSTFTVIDGPQCFDNIIWWKARTTDGVEGWMAEFVDGVYLLEPIQ